MWTAILATLNLTAGTDYDVWSVNTEASISRRERPSRPPSKESSPGSSADEQADRNRADRRQVVDDVEADSRRRLGRSSLAREQRIERRVQDEQRAESGARGPRSTGDERAGQRDRSESAEPVAPAEVEPVGAVPVRAMSATHGTPRRWKSVRIICRNVQRLRCVLERRIESQLGAGRLGAGRGRCPRCSARGSAERRSRQPAERVARAAPNRPESSARPARKWWRSLRSRKPETAPAAAVVVRRTSRRLQRVSDPL